MLTEKELRVNSLISSVYVSTEMSYQGGKSDRYCNSSSKDVATTVQAFMIVLATIMKSMNHNRIF